LGTAILGQLGIPKRVFSEESLAFLLPLLRAETDTDVLRDVCVALGHIHNRKAIGPVARLRKHPHEDVRYGVVHGLLRYKDKRAISALIELSRDTDEDVRDWATFGLGSMIDTDTEEIREALSNRLADEDSDTRHEAIVGLARRQDERALGPVISELSGDPLDITLLTLEAAAELKDERLCPYLLSVEKEWEGDDDSHTKRLEEALQECGCRKNR
jgi:HEAT repeat protein